MELISINIVIDVEHNLILISSDQKNTLLNTKYLKDLMSIKIMRIICSQNAPILKLHYLIDLINFPTVCLVIKLNQCFSIYNWLLSRNKTFWVCYYHN